MVKAPEERERNVYSGVVKWTRRCSSIALWILLISWWWTGNNPIVTLQSALRPGLNLLAPLPAERVFVILAVLWYGFVTQLTLRWAIWFPLYAIAWPATEALALVLRWTAVPLVQRIRGNPESKPSSIPLKRLWFSVLLVWLVALRGLDVWWAVWIPPLLAVPIWIGLLRWAYRFAIAPRNFVSLAGRMCTSLLEFQIKALKEAKTKGKTVEKATVVHTVVNTILARYSGDALISVVHRESLLLFAASLVLALAASSTFWGLVGFAAMSSDARALESYGFFAGESFAEAVFWAWGGMTTTIDFPGAAAPLWVKAVHSMILATGLFQLSFLMACFALMASAESERVAEDVRKALAVARQRLEEELALEQALLVAASRPADGGH